MDTHLKDSRFEAINNELNFFTGDLLYNLLHYMVSILIFHTEADLFLYLKY